MTPAGERPWWRDYYDDIDAKRLDSLRARHTEDVTVRTGSMSTIHGLEEAMAGQEAFMSSFRTLRHDFRNAWEIDDTTILEADVTYQRLDDATVVIPCVTVLHRRGGLVDDVRLYIDLAPLYAVAS